MQRPKTYQKIFLLSIFCLFYYPIHAQVFGGNPPSLRWKQINTQYSRIIFPTGLDSGAERISNIIQNIQLPTQNTIGNKIKKINIVLQNQSIFSNAYVGLGPFRSEFYTTPPQNSFDLGSLPWLDQLTIHEYRHVQQFNNFNVGLSRAMRSIFGEEGQILANNAAIPNWFYEGDAVFNETNLSEQGRGNLPSFFDGYRALWQAGKNYSWMKLRNGSFKDFVPNHYPLGYILVSYGRQKYGDSFWKNVTHDAAAFKNLFYPFQHAIKKYSGIDYTSFRNDALDFFKNQFEHPNIISEKNVHGKYYKNEEYPVFDEQGNLIYINSSVKNITKFILRSNDGERVIRVSDNTLDNFFSYRNGKIIYASRRPDIRWGNRQYNEVQILDVATGKQKTITHHSRYFSPSISGDSKYVVAVDVPASGESHLHILESKSGKIISEITNPQHLYYTTPIFYNSENIISPVRNNEGKMSIALVNINNGTHTFLLPFSFQVSGFPIVKNDTIYFTMTLEKNDELMAYSVIDKKLYKINSAKEIPGVGKYHASINDNDIAWSTFTAEGYRIVQMPKNEVTFLESSDFKKDLSSFGITSIRDDNLNLLSKTADSLFDIKPYHKGFKIFNFHSLEPTADDPQYTLSLISENILNTLQSALSFTYDRAERFKRLGFGGTYAGLFPLLTAGVNYTIDRKILYKGNPVYFNQLEPYAGFSIPLNLSKGRSFTFLTLGSQFVLNKSDFQKPYKDSFTTRSYSYLSNYAVLSHQSQQALQQLYPRFAQSLKISYKNPVTTYKGFQALASAVLYFPGVISTHSLQFGGAYLRKDSLGQINFSSGFPFSRGYQAANFYEMYQWNVNYHLPLAYPDAGFGNIFYLLRVRTSLFYDDTRVNDFFSNNTSFHARFRSVGGELTFDGKLWNQSDISFGVRYSHLLDPDLLGNGGSSRWEIILPVNLFNK